MKVIIAEKPSVAREIATVLNINEKHDGWIGNHQYAITWAFGHLIELCPPEAYGWKEWTKEKLPMLPNPFKLQPVQRWDPIRKCFSDDKGVLKQLSVIHDLFEKADDIIVATDAGREGELIFRLIYEYLNCKKPFERLWLSSLTSKAIQQGFKELKNGDAYDNLYYSARCRSEADWLVGMNASRALTISAAFQSRFSLGRVQTPTLSIICNRYQENKNFVSTPYYNVKITVAKQSSHFTARSENYTNKEVITSIFEEVQRAGKATVISVEKKEVTENAPLLYDLTTLQRDANKFFQFSADHTLKLAQSLYERKFITYPRTSSRYLTKDVFEKIPHLLEVAEKDDLYEKFAAELKNGALNDRCVNPDKVTDHHALLITEIYPERLGDKEQKIYRLILSRMIEAVSAASVKAVTQVTLDCAGHLFKAFGGILISAGWKAVGDAKVKFKDQEDEKDDEDQSLPELIPHETIDKTDTELLSKMTKPKPLYTEGTLLHAMETCGKDIDDESVREVLRDSGIGTPATRANIIETLIKRRYIERQKRYLVPTPKGLAVYALLKDKTIASPELTGQWERKLEQINQGAQDHVLFMNDIVDYTNSIIADILKIGHILQTSDLSETNVMAIPCPKCKNGSLKKSKTNYYCSDYPRKNADGTRQPGCDFVIWTTIAGKHITESAVRQISERGKSTLIKGFKSKANKEFNAKLILKTDWTVAFEFENNYKKA